MTLFIVGFYISMFASVSSNLNSAAHQTDQSAWPPYTACLAPVVLEDAEATPAAAETEEQHA